MSHADRSLRHVSRVLGLALLLLGKAAFGIDFTELQRLLPPDAAVDQFGAAVAVGDGVVAVGAYLSDACGKDSGAVYLYRKGETGWDLFHGMPLSQGSGDWFGFDVAIQGNRLVVGAPHAGRGPGAAYVYSFDPAAGTVDPQAASLTVPGARKGDDVGSAVAIDGGRVAVGARGADGRSGRVYVFPVAGGAPTAALPVTPPPAGVELGQSVVLRGDQLVAGAPLPGKDRRSPGAVYIFRLQPNGTWSQLDTLRPPSDLKAGAAFGYSVAVDGSKIVVGAPLADLKGSEAGAVYVFPGNSPIEGGRGDQLGVAVAAEGGRTVIGARGADSKRGIAYLYDRDGSRSILTPESRAERGELGFGTAIYGETVAVGAFKEGGRGAVYVFGPIEPVEVTFHFDKAQSSQGREGEKVSVSVVLETDRALTKAVTAKVSVSSDGEDDVSISPSAVTFPAGSENGAQKTVEISLLSDCLAEGKETFKLMLSDAYDKVIDNLQIKILDGDNVAAVELILPGAEPLVTDDSGREVVFQVRLTCPPTDEVTVTLASTNPAEGKVVSPSPPVLSFLPEEEKWSEPQAVTVRGQRDDDADCADEPYQVTLTLSSADPAYNGVVDDPLDFVNEEDEGACVSVSAEAVADICSTEDGTVQYMLEIENTGNVELADRAGPEILESLPDEVTVVMASADRGAATVDYVANEIAWTGSIPVGTTATIQILASLEAGVAAGTEVVFEGVYSYDGGTAEFARDFTVGETDPCVPPE